MENKWIFIGIALIAAIVILGCAQKEEASAQVETPAVVESVAPVVVENPIPLYNAPLEGSKIKKTCGNDSDCRLILVQTGAGQTRECISTASGYEGGVSTECICKFIDKITESFANGTEHVRDNYECRHIV